MTAWQDGDVIANGIRVHYYRSGHGDKPAVVLLHGVTDFGLCWAPVARRLGADYDVVMLDARGHGRSEVPASGYGVQTLAADAIAAIRALGLGRPVVGGHSMGGATANFVAAQMPETRAVILEDPAWFPPFAPEDAAAEAGAFAQMVDGWAGKTREDILAMGRAESPHWSEDELGPWADSKLFCSRQITQVDVTGGVAWQSILAQVRCPALLLTADPERGAILTPEVAAEARAACPQMEVTRIAGAGHNIRRDAFEAYMAAVSDFLARVTR